jgi:hypothetical protein
MIYTAPIGAGVKTKFKANYDNVPCCKWAASIDDEYFNVIAKF